MLLFYIETQRNEILALDVTEQIDYTLPSKITSNPVETGSVVSENIVLENPSVLFRGVISDVNTSRSTTDFIKRIEALRAARELFTVYLLGGQKALKNCFFKNVRFNQDNTFASVATQRGVKSAYQVEFSFEQLNVIERVAEEVIYASEVYDNASKKSSTSGATSFEDSIREAGSALEKAFLTNSLADKRYEQARTGSN